MNKVAKPANTPEGVSAFKDAAVDVHHLHVNVYLWWDRVNGNSYHSYSIQCGDTVLHSEYNCGYGDERMAEQQIRKQLEQLFGLQPYDVHWHSKHEFGTQLYRRLHFSHAWGLKRTMLSYGKR